MLSTPYTTAKQPKSSTLLFFLLSDSGTFSVLNAEEREREGGVASSLFLLQRAGFEVGNERWVVRRGGLSHRLDGTRNREG